MITGEMMSIAVISMILIFVLQSFGLGFLSLVPNLVPAGMAFGIWGLTVGQVGMASSVVAAMTLGILVDDTVHFLSKYQYARKDKDLSPEDALHYAFSTVGNALWTTSAVLILGFSLFTLSSFRINFEMGLLVSIIFALGLFAEFLLLPPILLAYEGFMARMALNPPRFVEQVMSSWDGLCQLLPSTSVPAQPVATGSTYERRTSSAASASHQPRTSDRTYGRQSETAKASHKRRATDRKYGRNQDFVKSGEGRRASDGKYEKYTDFKIEYHFIWATQARHKVLVGAIATRLRELIKHACDTLDAQVIKGTVNKDYVHIIVSAPPIVTPEDIVQRIKNRTALKLFEEYPALRECATAERFWARGYFCATVGKITERMVKDYLEQHGSGIDKGVNLAKTGTEQ
jgi:REP element-mobilizing transposase RayT